MIPTHRPYLSEAELAAVAEVFDSRWLGMGAVTQEFETALREFLGVKHVIAVSSGTAALHLALDVLNLQRGDEIIMPSLTFISAAQVSLAVGARPVFCEVNADTLNIDMHDVVRRITPRTKVIMPLHYAGYACDMNALMSVARAHGIRVIEDAAHAFGSLYEGRKLGTLADIGCFSFDPIKNITCGEGGLVATNDDQIAERLARKRVLGIASNTWARLQHEKSWFYEVATTGYRYHLSNINAAIGLVQLKQFDAFMARKQEIVRCYNEAFKHLAGLALVTRYNPEVCPFMYVVRVLDQRRDELMAHLKAHNIGSGVYYIPNHLQPLFAAEHVTLPVTERVYGEILTLPLYYEMSSADIEQVIDGLRSFFPQTVTERK